LGRDDLDHATACAAAAGSRSSAASGARGSAGSTADWRSGRCHCGNIGACTRNNAACGRDDTNSGHAASFARGACGERGSRDCAGTARRVE
jgi:hypothetical protein